MNLPKSLYFIDYINREGFVILNIDLETALIILIGIWAGTLIYIDEERRVAENERKKKRKRR